MKKLDRIKLLTQYSHKIAKHYLVMGTMGNISLREGDDVWIKRGGVWLERAKPQDFVKVSLKKGANKRNLVSKEIDLHLGCYKARSDINAVIHTHPKIATGLATALPGNAKIRAKIKPKIGSNIIIIKYYPPGSKKLAKEVSKAVKKTNVVLMSGHGLVTVGESLREAYQRTLAIESEAKRIILKALG